MILALIILNVISLSVSVYLLFAIRKINREYKKLKVTYDKSKEALLKSQTERNRLINFQEERNDIVSIVAHDLKSPLNRIYALIRLLSMEGENLTVDQKGYIGKMHQVIADGLSLVRNMLDIRMIENQGIELYPEKINLSNFVMHELKQHKALADFKNLRLVADVPADIIIESDKQYLGRIIDNLLSNAIKFSPVEKEINVKIEEHDNHVMLSIKDEGPGFKLDELPRVFQRYQKFSAKPTGGESSTGLGLSIVESLSDKLNFRLQCISKEGEGAEFIVEIKKSGN